MPSIDMKGHSYDEFYLRLNVDGAVVFPKDVAEAMIKEADGNPRKLEALLGLDEGSLGASPKMVLPQEVHNYRIPDGNGGGSRDNPQW